MKSVGLKGEDLKEHGKKGIFLADFYVLQKLGENKIGVCNRTKF